MSNHIAVTDEMKGQAGRIVYWRLNGGVDYDRLVELWEASDLDDALIPQPTGPQRALQQAVTHLKGGRLLGRATISGYSLVQEVIEADQPLVYLELVRARLAFTNKLPELVIEPGPHADQRESLADALGDELVKVYEECLDQLDSSVVSSWLVRTLLPLCQAVGLRDRGGIYFIPANHLDMWDKIVQIFTACSDHQMFQIPALASEDAVNAILDALVGETDEVMSKLEAELEGELGKRAIANREHTCTKLLSKLESYEALLDVRLDTIRDRVGQAQTNLAILALSEAAA